jgi:acyl-ACP thioesterase
MKTERIDEYSIHSYDCDMNGKLSFPVLTRFLQETAWLNAEDMQLGFQKFKENNMAWVLYKQYIEMKEWLQWGDNLILKTWLSQSDKLLCYREFEIYKNELLMGKVSTSWLVIDTIKRRPVRTSRYYNDEFKINSNILFPEIIKTKMKLSDDKTSRSSQKVSISDIDINNHVTNSCYPRWCLDCYPIDFYKKHTLIKIEQQFAAEALIGDDLTIFTHKLDDLHYEHKILRNEKELFLLRLNWSPNNYE